VPSLTSMTDGCMNVAARFSSTIDCGC
jgi:hypothetical protein